MVMTLSSRERTPISENNSCFTLFVLSRTSDMHYFSKYWGGRMHGSSPHLKFFGGTVLPVSSRSPPVLRPQSQTLLLGSRSFTTVLRKKSVRRSSKGHRDSGLYPAIHFANGIICLNVSRPAGRISAMGVLTVTGGASCMILPHP